MRCAALNLQQPRQASWEHDGRQQYAPWPHSSHSRMWAWSKRRWPFLCSHVEHSKQPLVPHTQHFPTLPLGSQLRKKCWKAILVLPQHHRQISRHR